MKINLGKYWALCEIGAPKAIPTMCILTIKKDENLLPLRTKSRIIVLGNHEAEFEVKAFALPPLFAKTVFISLLALLSKSTVFSIREIVRLPSARVHFQTTTSLLYTHQARLPEEQRGQMVSQKIHKGLVAEWAWRDQYLKSMFLKNRGVGKCLKTEAM
jgi:hypothetical protein